MTTLHRSSSKKLHPPSVVEEDFETRASTLEMLGSLRSPMTTKQWNLNTTRFCQGTPAMRLYSTFDHHLPWGTGQVTSPLGREGSMIRFPRWGRSCKTVAQPKEPRENTLREKEPEDIGAQRPSLSCWFGWRSGGCPQWRLEAATQLWGLTSCELVTQCSFSN